MHFVLSAHPPATVPFLQSFCCSGFKDVARDVICEVLAGGFEGGQQAARRRAEAAEAAYEILEEVCVLLEPPTLDVSTTTL